MTFPPATVPEPVPVHSTREEIFTGVTMTVPLALGYVPLGLAYGLLVAQLGLPWWMAPALSLAAYSGSAELLVVALAAQYSPLSVIAVTMLLVNFRHVFYAFSFPLHVVEGRFARFYSMYALVDEAYALTVARPNGWTQARLLAMQVTFQLTWVLSGIVGVGLGAFIPSQIRGLDFALCAMFITLALDAVRDMSHVPSVLLAGVSYALAPVILPEQALLTGLLLFVTSLCIRHLYVRAHAHGSSSRPREQSSWNR